MAERGRLAPEEDERRKNRPYRRLLTSLFVLAAAILCALTLRGIIRTLDRLPSVDRLHQPDQVDTRALIACADDLMKLEAATRRLAARALTETNPTGPLVPWAEHTRALEIERLSVVARCRLSEPADDPAVRDLARAASALEALMRSYGLLYDRFRAEGHASHRDAVRAISSARAALKTRE